MCLHKWEPVFVKGWIKGIIEVRLVGIYCIRCNMGRDSVLNKISAIYSTKEESLFYKEIPGFEGTKEALNTLAI